MSETPAKRERKQTTFFSTQEKAAKVAVETQQGEGLVLADYPYFVESLTKLRGDDEVVKGLHSLLFNNPGKKLETKKNLRAFNGFPAGVNVQDKIDKVSEKKKAWTVSNLKIALGLFGLEKGGDREALVKRLVEYLAKPTVATKATAPSSAKKSVGKKRKGKKSKKSSEPKKKRAMSAFMLFSQAHRGEVKEKNPELTFGETGKELGRLWSELNEEQKKEWQEKAAAAKAELGEDEAAASEEGSDGEDEEEESGNEGSDGAEDDPFKTDEEE